MRHNVDGRKLGRTSSHKKAMFRNMAASLILHDRIETTLPKAKELRRIADRLVTLGKRQTLHARRRAARFIHSKPALIKLFDELAGRFSSRNGGYTRIMKLGWRHGDSAPMATIEYLSSDGGHARKTGDAGGGQKKSHDATQKSGPEKTAKPVAGKPHGAKKIFSKKPLDLKKPAKRSMPTHRAPKGD